MGFWKNKKILITGHTGFKGSWLSLLLKYLNAEVIGFSLDPPTEVNLFTLANVKEDIASIKGDIRDREQLINIIKSYKPEIVFHLAAQSLVRKSYKDPLDTFETNIMGTINLFEAIRLSDSVKAIVNVTSDKCYENKEKDYGYKEIDPMGGDDPYSCSKGCSELITNSYRKSYFDEKNICLSSARAGNVIGGGDFAVDRLVPDIIKSIISGENVKLRNPNAYRPWQHVLEPIYGYILLAEKMYREGKRYAEPFNFGTSQKQITAVGKLSELIFDEFDKKNKWAYDKLDHPHEAKKLQIDSSKAKDMLDWETIMTINQTIKWTVEWYKAYMNNENIRDITLNQIDRYMTLRREKNE